MIRAFNALGLLGTVVTTTLNLGCCAGVLGSLASVLFAGGILEWIPTSWQLPLLYGALGVTLLGLGVGWRRHRWPHPLLLYSAGAAAVLYPFHEALEVSIMGTLIWAGFGVLLAASVLDAWLSFRIRRCRPFPFKSRVVA